MSDLIKEQTLFPFPEPHHVHDSTSSVAAAPPAAVTAPPEAAADEKPQEPTQPPPVAVTTPAARKRVSILEPGDPPRLYYPTSDATLTDERPAGETPLPIPQAVPAGQPSQPGQPDQSRQHQPAAPRAQPRPQPQPRSPAVQGPEKQLPQPQPAAPVAAGHRRFLTPSEWRQVAQGVGALSDPEAQRPSQPTRRPWPARGMPAGLYRDVVAARARARFKFHCLSVARWVLLVGQIIIGAVLTALGSVSSSAASASRLRASATLAVTVLAGVNTFNAGLLALMHNSGLPDRYRSDAAEYQRVEDHIRELVDGGLVESDDGSADDVLAASANAADLVAGCFDMMRQAKATVASNVPSAYTTGAQAALEQVGPKAQRK